MGAFLSNYLKIKEFIHWLNLSLMCNHFIVSNSKSFPIYSCHYFPAVYRNGCIYCLKFEFVFQYCRENFPQYLKFSLENFLLKIFIYNFQSTWRIEKLRTDIQLKTIRTNFRPDTNHLWIVPSNFERFPYNAKVIITSKNTCMSRKKLLNQLNILYNTA